jgi:hypothetical protein
MGTFLNCSLLSRDYIVSNIKHINKYNKCDASTIDEILDYIANS